MRKLNGHLIYEVVDCFDTFKLELKKIKRYVPRNFQGRHMRFLIFTGSFFLLLSTSDSQARRIPKFSPNDPHVIIENLSAQKQEKTQWCWAAISRMLMSSATTNLPDQCEIVSKTLGLNCCLEDSIQCNQPFYPTKALEAFGIKYVIGQAMYYPERHWSGRVDNKGWYNSVVQNIKLRKPVAITRFNRAGTQDSTAHIVLAYGTYSKNNKDYLIIFDPWKGTSLFWDETYVTGFMAWTSTLTLE